MNPDERLALTANSWSTRCISSQASNESPSNLGKNRRLDPKPSISRGKSGRTFTLKAGDVAVLPSGTGHQSLSASADFLVVGAYPPTGTYDVCTSIEDHARALKTIPKVGVPRKDPVYGKDGSLSKLWKRPK
jgi:hypothetical protein